MIRLLTIKLLCGCEISITLSLCGSLSFKNEHHNNNPDTPIDMLVLLCKCHKNIDADNFSHTLGVYHMDSSSHTSLPAMITFQSKLRILKYSFICYFRINYQSCKCSLYNFSPVNHVLTNCIYTNILVNPS